MKKPFITLVLAASAQIHSADNSFYREDLSNQYRNNNKIELSRRGCQELQSSNKELPGEIKLLDLKSAISDFGYNAESEELSQRISYLLDDLEAYGDYAPPSVTEDAINVVCQMV